MNHEGLSICNPDPQQLAGPSLLHQLVATATDATALEYLCEDEHLLYSYKHLQDASSDLSKFIGSFYAGASQDEDIVVPILMPQCPHLYISLLAILKAGGAFCPLNLDAPPERLKFILEDVSAKIVLVTQQVADQIPSESVVQVIIVDEAGSCFSSFDEPKQVASPDSLAYVMYTSGSTGMPKGVGVTHSAATQALLAHDRHIPDFSRFLQFAAPTFDVSVFEIFFPLFRGATLIAVGRVEMLNDLPGVMRRMAVDSCELTPTVAGSLLKRRKNVPTLSLLLTIGEMLTTPVVEEFGGSIDRVGLLWAMYGPTEATIHCTLQANLASTSSPGNIGRPLDTVSCFVIKSPDSPTENLEFIILPKGEAGELVVGGHQLARGYINRPRQTSSAFIDSPYGRVYRTGDRAIMNADGTLECLGRLSDGQVKLRGQRIELGEIEHVALRTLGCHGAKGVVVASSLVLFCAVDHKVSEAAIEDNCKSWLPKYMIPNEIVLMNEFPRLPSGKVDGKRLQEEFIIRKASEAVANDSEDEADLRRREIMRIVSETLNVKVNMQSVLTSAGLDSLSAIKLASALRTKGFNISVARILSLRDLEDMCAHIEDEKQTMAASVDVMLEHDQLDHTLRTLPDDVRARCELHGIEYSMPCTPLQSAMLAQTTQDPILYCNEILLRTVRHIPVQDLVDSFQKAIQTNEALRTGFAYRSGRYISIVFSTPRPNQIVVKTQLERGFSLKEAIDLLQPFRIQLAPEKQGERMNVLLQAHHAVYDGWSMDMLLSDVARSLARKPLPQRPAFRHVAHFHNSHSNDPKDISRAFWSETLLGWSKIPFPKLLSRVAENEIETHTVMLDIPASSVRELVQKYGLSPQVLFQTSVVMAWQGVTGQLDVLMGSVFSGRTIPVGDIDQIFGPCVATMPLRINLGKMKANIDVLRAIHTQNRLIMDHCDLSISEIGKLAGLKSTDTLYDVLFVYQQSLYDNQVGGGVFEQIEHVDRLETKLLVEVEPRSAGHRLQITYHSAFANRDFVECIAQQIQWLSSNILSEPEGVLKTAGVYENDGASIYNAKTNIDEEPNDVVTLFEASAERSPHAEALRIVSSVDGNCFKVNTMSYTVVSQAANRIAHFVRTYGTEVGDVVAIIMNKSVAMYTTILGVLKAGCAYLPLLPSTPVQRIGEILRQSKSGYCIVDSSGSDAPTLPETVTVININDPQLSTMKADNISIPPNPDRLAYVIFTSGTTGVPKGVAVSQRNLASNIAHLASVYPKASPQPRLLQACSFAFDVSVFEIFYAWHAGMSLCAAENDILFRDIEHAIRELAITHLSLTPTVASLIEPKNVPQVEFLVTAGEPMTSTVLQRWDCLLFQGYGPSETTNICSVKRMSHGEHIEHLGWVFPNTSVAVLSPHNLDILPCAWVGEFCFGGSQVANGYLNDDVLTAQKFIQHPILGRLYRSGDIGRMLPDGSLMIIGRLDDQLKLRGQRIEANEINGILTATKLVTSAVTSLTFTGPTTQSGQLATFYTSHEMTEHVKDLPIRSDLQKTLFSNLKARLPSYMIPAYLIPISRIPMTSSGKVDRRKLNHYIENLGNSDLMRLSDDTSERGDDVEWNRDEKLIAETIADSCKISRHEIGKWMPFPALGIDSISAIGIAGLLSDRMGHRIPISAILRNPTVAQLSQALTEGDVAGANQGKHEIQELMQKFSDEVRTTMQDYDSDIESVMPCMPLQEAMLLQSQRSYYNKTLLRLRIPPERMQSYWKEIVRRHGILRTCFVTTMNRSYPIAQVVLREWSVPWQSFQVTVPSLEDASREHVESLPNPLNSRIPPFSLALIRYKGSNFLSFVCHHALYDGIAMENLWKEIESMARGCTLPAPVAYAPFLREALALPADVEYFWRNEFRGFEQWPSLARSTNLGLNQCTNSISMDMSFKELQSKIKSLGVSLLALCQASWAAVLSFMFERLDIAFGNVVNGRTLAINGIDKLIAPCFNTVPLRLDISRSAQNIDLLKAYLNLNSRLMAYQFSPLKLVQKVVETRREKLFNTLLLLQQPLRDMDKSVWTLEEDAGNMDVPIVCEVIPCPNLNSVFMNLHYDMDMVTNDLASTISDMFRSMLRFVVSNPYDAVPTRQSLPSSHREALRGLAIKRIRESEVDTSKENKADWSSLETKIRNTIVGISETPLHAVKRHTTIFQMGLDSINAVQIASKLRSQGLSVSSTDVVECATCERLAARILNNTGKLRRGDVSANFASYQQAVAPEILEKVPMGTDFEAALPCTSLQNAMISRFLGSSEGQYLNFLTYDVRNSISPQNLKDAWKKLQQFHPMLRTGFVPTSELGSSFSMVRWREECVKCPVEIFQKPGCKDFNAPKWKEESRTLMANTPGLCLWRVALERDERVWTMHIAMHHALYDATSLADIFNALSRVLRGVDAKFTPIEPALAQMLLRSRNLASESQDFWTEKAETVVVNKFPIMTPLVEHNRRTLSCQKTLSMTFAEMHTLGKLSGISMQAAFQATWARLLSSFLGETSVVFGVVLSGRTTEETEKAPFPCLATVPIIADASSSNKKLLKDMMDYNSTLHRHQFSPLSDIQKWLGHAGSPVFDTVLVYQKKQPSSSDMEWDLIADEPSVEYTVSIELEHVAHDELWVRVTTHSDILPKEQAELMLRQFDATLAHLLKSPDGTASELHSSHPDIFSITPAQSPSLEAPNELVHQLVERQAEIQPGFPALEFFTSSSGDFGNSRTWTYKELDEMGNQAAHLLAETVTVGDIVAVHFPKCPEAYFCLLGIMKAGCSFLALDPDAPEARKRFILQDSNTACLCTDGSFDASELGIPVLNIDVSKLASYPTSRVILAQNISSQESCYCLYTSGTTGTPKGCQITHENTVQALMAFQNLFHGHWQTDSRWLQFASLHFDVSVLEQYWSWSVGITVVAAPKELILDDLMGSINKLAITHIDLTPSLARLTHPDQLPSLCNGVFITGGEQLNQEILDAWGPKAVIYNAYGPTEATIGVTMYQRVPVNGRPSNIGKQFPNVGSFVFQSGTEIPVLRGGVGELCVSGKLVGKGYLHRPELTKERFPVLAGFGNERIYRTGDLVRILYNGCFEFLGRADDQVKLRGQRLEIGEINHIISKGTPGVKCTATIVIKTGKKDVLVAFVAGATNHTTSNVRIAEDASGLAAQARTACIQHLPGYMIPTYFILLTHIPLSSNNKVEAKELKALFKTLTQQDLMKFTGRDSLTMNETIDSDVFHIVAKVLAAFGNVPEDQISLTTSIFDLGIDSLSVLQVSSILKKNGIAGATPAVMINRPIMFDLVREVSMDLKISDTYGDEREVSQRLQAWKHRYQTIVCRDFTIALDDIEYIVPCSPLQEGMISAALAGEMSRPYFNWFDIELPVGASLASLRQAWEQTIQNHSVLRSIFVKTIDGYLQVALKRMGAFWHDVYIDDDNVDGAMALEYSKWVAQNLSNLLSPLQLVHVAGRNIQQIRLHIFHGLYDGNSLELMKDDISRTYWSMKPQLGPKFVDALCRGPLRNFDFCRSFWEEHLSKWSLSTLPRQAASAKTTSNVETLFRQLPISDLVQLRKQENVTLQTIILSIWTVVLQHYTSQPLTLGVIVAGRAIDLPGVERTMGPLFNTIPFFNDTLQGLTWQRLVKHCHRFNAETLSFQHVPLKDIQKWCSNGRPLFDNLFAFQVEKPGSVSKKTTWKFVEGRSSSVDYPIAFEATQTTDGYVNIQLVVRDGVISLKEMGRMFNDFNEIIYKVKSDTELGTLSYIKAARDDIQSDDNPDAETTPALCAEWTTTALAIRKEFCEFANTPLGDVKLTTSVGELGFDSIDAIRISARMAKKGMRLSASRIMRLQTLSAITAATTSVEFEDPINAPLDSFLPELQSRLRAYLLGKDFELDAIELVLPSTSLQQSMVAEMIQSDFEWYFNHNIFELDAAVDLMRLQNAWLDVIATSPILRTGFAAIEDSRIDAAYCQVVFKKSNMTINLEESSDVPTLRDITFRAREKAQLGQGLRDLLQISLFSTPQKAFMVISIAHALYDGWSLGLLYDDLRASYDGNLRSREYLRTLTSQSVLFRAADIDGFWKTYLSNARPTIFREQETLYAIHGSDLVYRKESLDSQALSKIMSFCKRNSLSLQSLCLACWGVVAAHLSKSLDTMLGVVLSGRDFEGADELMFPTMNTIAFRSIVHGSAMSFLRYIDANLAEIRGYQAVPLRKVQATAGHGGAQMFNSLFILQKPQSAESFKSMWTSVDGHSSVEYPVCVETEAIGNNLKWRIACKGHYFSESDTEEILKKLQQTLAFFVDSPEREALSFRGHCVSICGLPETDVSESLPSSVETQTVIIQHNELQDSFSWDETTRRLRAILSDVSAVPVESILPTSTLYQLGLDSISAIKVSLMLRRADIHLKPRELLHANSIVEMASSIDREQSTATKISTAQLDWKLPASLSENACFGRLGIGTHDVEAILPATAMQIHMLSAWQQSNGAVFFPKFCLQVSRKYTKEQLSNAWATLIQSVPILRTVLVSTGAQEVPWVQMLVRADPASAPKFSQRFVSLEIEYSQSSDSWVLGLSIHHALYDGFSLPEIFRTYRGFLRQDATANEIALDIDIVSWREFSVLPTTETEKGLRKKFWQDYLKDCLPSSYEANASPTSSSQMADRVSYLRKQALHDSNELQKIAASLGIGVQSLFMAAFAQILLNRTVHQDLPQSVVFGVYLANRSLGFANMHGTYPTLNLVPLRALFSGKNDIISVAMAIHKDLQLIQSDSRAQVGLWEIYNWTGIQVDIFVNFLSSQNDREDEETEDNDFCHKADLDRPVDYSKSMGLLNQSWVQNNVVKDSYAASTDIEVSIHGQGLDIGVFGSARCLTHDEAPQMVDSIIQHLKDIKRVAQHAK